MFIGCVEEKLRSIAFIKQLQGRKEDRVFMLLENASAFPVLLTRLG